MPRHETPGSSACASHRCADLAGRESLQRQSGLLGMHAAAVISHLDETSPAIDQFDVNTRAASIEGIVEEFLQTEVGRSMTSPAAMRLDVVGSSR